MVFGLFDATCCECLGVLPVKSKKKKISSNAMLTRFEKTEHIKQHVKTITQPILQTLKCKNKIKHNN